MVYSTDAVVPRHLAHMVAGFGISSTSVPNHIEALKPTDKDVTRRSLPGFVTWSKATGGQVCIDRSLGMMKPFLLFAGVLVLLGIALGAAAWGSSVAWQGLGFAAAIAVAMAASTRMVFRGAHYCRIAEGYVVIGRATASESWESSCTLDQAIVRVRAGTFRHRMRSGVAPWPIRRGYAVVTIETLDRWMVLGATKNHADAHAYARQIASNGIALDNTGQCSITAFANI